jgi:hypothetical protein
MRRRKRDAFSSMHEAAIGMAGLGVTTAVGAGIQAQAPAGTPNMMGGFNTLAGFAPIAVTAHVGKSLLPKRKKSKYRF